MREPDVRTVRGSGGNGGSATSPPSAAPKSQAQPNQPSKKVRTLKRITSASARTLAGIETRPIESLPPATRDTKRDWPILLGQRLRDSDWISPQVLLLGKLECRSPDPLTVLNIGGRYEINHRDLRAARAQLSEAEQAAITAYLHRPSHYVSRRVDGELTLREQPPEMHKAEAEAFGALWRVLEALNMLRRPTLLRSIQKGREAS